MSRVLAIAANTLREARRDKIFYSILFFALAMILSSVVFTELTIAHYDRVLIDVGTGAIDFFGAVIAIFLGIGLVSREVHRKTVYTIVTKPIHRAEFILGKFAGLLGVLTTTLGVMFVCLLLVLFAWSEDPVNLGTLLWYIVLALVQLSVVVAFAILMSSFTGTAVSAFCTVGVYIIGHWTRDLYLFGQRSESVLVQWITKSLFYVLPNLDRFSVSREIAYGEAVDAGMAATSILYGLLYVTSLLLAAVFVFSRRDFK